MVTDSQKIDMIAAKLGILPLPTPGLGDSEQGIVHNDISDVLDNLPNNIISPIEADVQDKHDVLTGLLDDIIDAVAAIADAVAGIHDAVTETIQTWITDHFSELVKNMIADTLSSISFSEVTGDDD